MKSAKFYMNYTIGTTITIFAIGLIALGGWIANIVKLVGMLDGGINAWFVARCVGVFVAPLGAVLGFL